MNDYVVICIEDREKWREELRGIKHSFFHSWEYCNQISLADKRVCLLKIITPFHQIYTTFYIREVISGVKDVTIPYGFGGIIVNGDPNVQFDSELFIENLNRFAEDNKIIALYLTNHPSFDIPPGFNGIIEEHHRTYDLEINTEEKALWSRLNKGFKYDINRALKDDNIEFRSIDSNVLYDMFIDLYFLTMNRVNASNTYYFDRKFIKGLLNGSNSKCIGAFVGDELVCGALFLFKNEIGEYFLSAAKNEYRYITRSLIWKMIQNLKDENVLKINLGGGVEMGDSLDDFKRRFGGNERKLYSLKLIFDENKYLETCSNLKVDVNSNYFPAYWKPKT